MSNENLVSQILKKLNADGSYDNAVVKNLNISALYILLENIDTKRKFLDLTNFLYHTVIPTTLQKFSDEKLKNEDNTNNTKRLVKSDFDILQKYYLFIDKIVETYSSSKIKSEKIIVNLIDEKWKNFVKEHSDERKHKLHIDFNPIDMKYIKMFSDFYKVVKQVTDMNNRSFTIRVNMKTIIQQYASQIIENQKLARDAITNRLSKKYKLVNTYDNKKILNTLKDDIEKNKKKYFDAGEYILLQIAFYKGSIEKRRKYFMAANMKTFKKNLNVKFKIYNSMRNTNIKRMIKDANREKNKNINVYKKAEYNSKLDNLHYALSKMQKTEIQKTSLTSLNLQNIENKIRELSERRDKVPTKKNVNNNITKDVLLELNKEIVKLKIARKKAFMTKVGNIMKRSEATNVSAKGILSFKTQLELFKKKEKNKELINVLNLEIDRLASRYTKKRYESLLSSTNNFSPKYKNILNSVSKLKISSPTNNNTYNVYERKIRSKIKEHENKTKADKKNYYDKLLALQKESYLKNGKLNSVESKAFLERFHNKVKNYSKENKNIFSKDDSYYKEYMSAKKRMVEKIKEEFTQMYLSYISDYFRLQEKLIKSRYLSNGKSENLSSELLSLSRSFSERLRSVYGVRFVGLMRSSLSGRVSFYRRSLLSRLRVYFSRRR